MSASPSYGERPPLQGGFRRSFTLPTRQLSVHERAGLDKSDAVADILYTHPSARIISFCPPPESIKSNSKAEIPPDTDYPVDTVETLPWRSRTETLAATGPMIIEKVRGSTNFLKCQGVTHAILRNSQCWCVDGESKFVLRVRKFQYYRIELPSTAEEDKAKVEELKKVFPIVLRYERTPCPFIRAFTVELPDDAITPRRKGQWKRRDSSQSNTPEPEHPTLRRTHPTRSYSLRTPPTSYPRGGPDSSFENERGRTGQARALPFLRGEYRDYGHSSPNRYAESDDGTESEHPESEHDSEVESTTDRSETASPKKNLSNETNTEALEAVFGEDVAIVVPKHRTVTIRGHDLPLEAQDISAKTTRPQEVSSLESSLEGPAEVNMIKENESHSSEIQNIILPAENVEVERPSAIDDNNAVVVVSSEMDGLKPEEKQHKEAVPEKVEDAAPDPDNSIGSNDKLNVGIETSEFNLHEANRAQSNSTYQPNTESDPIQAEDEADIVKPNLQNDSQLSTAKLSAKSSDSHSILEPEITLETESLDVSGADITTDEAELSEESMLPEPAMDVLSLESSNSSWEGPNTKEIDEQLQELEALQQTSRGLMLDDESPGRNTGGESRSSPLFTALLENVELSKPLPRSITLGTEDTQDDDHLSTVSSIDSFHTIASPLNEQTYGEDELGTIQRGRLTDATLHHKRELSEMTVTMSIKSDAGSPENHPGSRRGSNQLQTPLLLRSSASDASWPEPSTPSFVPHDQDGVRQRKSRKTFSPPPPASTIFTGDQIRHDSGGGHMTKVILQKMIVKPIEMAIFFVHILARIAGGATVNDLLSGELFKRPEHHRRISGFADQLHGGKSTSDTEDDYGVPVRGRRRSTERRHAMIMDEEDEDRLEDID